MKPCLICHLPLEWMVCDAHSDDESREERAECVACQGELGWWVCYPCMEVVADDRV